MHCGWSSKLPKPVTSLSNQACRTPTDPTAYGKVRLAWGNTECNSGQSLTHTRNFCGENPPLIEAGEANKKRATSHFFSLANFCLKGTSRTSKQQHQQISLSSLWSFRIKRISSFLPKSYLGDFLSTHQITEEAITKWSSSPSFLCWVSLLKPPLLAVGSAKLVRSI